MAIKKIFQKIDSGIGRSLILLVRVYQRSLGPVIGGRCRYYPSCSEYFIGAVEKYGPWRGSARGAWRILRCHPFSKGGYDPY